MELSKIYFLASLLGFNLGPLLHSTFREKESWNEWMDGFTLASVGGIVLIHLLPEAVQKGGIFAILLIFLGLILPTFLERLFFKHTKFKGAIILLVGLFFHTLLESAALGNVRQGESSNLGLAILIHRFPVGLLLFSFFKNHKNTLVATLVIIFISATSIFGFYLGNALDAIISEPFSIYLDVFVSSSLLHIAFDNHSKLKVEEEDHHHHHDETHSHIHHHEKEDLILGFFKSSNFWSALGAISGFFMLIFILGEPKNPRGQSYSLSILSTFLSLSLESAPALVIGYFFAGLFKSFFPSSGGNTFLHGGSNFLQSLKGVAFGLPLPICSCGVLPLYESMIKSGVPISAGIGFLIATPELGIDTILISLPLLGKELTFLRLVVAFLIALIVSYILGKLFTSPYIENTHQKTKLNETQLDKIKKGLEFGFIELFDHTMPWILMGLFLAAVIEPLFNYDSFKVFPDYLQVPIFALIGIPFYVCATGATPIAAIAIHKGISAGAAIAFLISGPATNLTTFVILSKLHNKKIAVYFGILVTLVAVICGWLINQFHFTNHLNLLQNGKDENEMIGYLSLLLLGFLSIFSLARQGSRGVLQQLLDPLK